MQTGGCHSQDRSALFPSVIKGVVASSLPASGVSSPGEASYGIDWTLPDGSPVIGTTGWKTAWPYVWPDFAKVEPARMVGKTVYGMQTADRVVVWFFVEPIAGTVCGQSASQVAAMLRGPGGGDTAQGGGRQSPDGAPGETSGPDGGGTA